MEERRKAGPWGKVKRKRKHKIGEKVIPGHSRIMKVVHSSGGGGGEAGGY